MLRRYTRCTDPGFVREGGDKGAAIKLKEEGKTEQCSEDTHGTVKGQGVHAVTIHLCDLTEIYLSTGNSVLFSLPACQLECSINGAQSLAHA